MDKITSFSGEYRWLSNFWPCEIDLDGCLYASVEHAYQASKTKDKAERKTIRECSTAGKAKRAGRKITLRSDWNEIKVDMMLEFLRQKFSENPLQKKLIATEDVVIVEGNTWGDTFWGICKGIGINMMGTLLMIVRDEKRENEHN